MDKDVMLDFKKKMKEQYVLGTWSEIPTPYVSNIVAKAGMDFQIIDMEHGVFDFELAQNMLFAIKCEGRATFLRVPDIDEAYILRALDLGADGLIFPQVKNISDIDNIIKYTKYAPIGEKGFNPYVYTGGYRGVSGDFFEKQNRKLSLGIILESKETIENIEDFVKNPEIDIYYIGQYDLSVSYGVPGQVNHPLILEALDKAVKAVKSANKIAGCMVHSPKEARTMIEAGYRFVVYKVDSGVLYSAFYDFKTEVDAE